MAISWGTTGVIKGTFSLHYLWVWACGMGGKREEDTKCEKTKNGKGGHLIGL